MFVLHVFVLVRMHRAHVVWLVLSGAGKMPHVHYALRQRQKSTIFGKKKKKVLLKSVFDIARLVRAWVTRTLHYTYA